MYESDGVVDYIFKIVLVGDSGVGKTNILSSLMHGEPATLSKPTIGVEFGTKTFKFKNSIVKVQIWDTAGQERYHAITFAYYRGASGAVIVYDLTKNKSLRNIESVWLNNLKKIIYDDIPLLFLGNKKDLVEQRVITEEQGKNIAIKNKAAFFETSALNGENIVEAFEMFIETLYKKEKNNKIVKVRRDDIFNKQLNKKVDKNKKTSCC